jgi:hypothetical protein
MYKSSTKYAAYLISDSLTYLPFIICDMYIRDDTCIYSPITNTSIGFSFDTWLVANAFTWLVIIPGIIVIGSISFCCEQSPIWRTIVLSCLLFVMTFMFIWLIIGGVMFWGYLYPNHLCSVSL